MGGERLAVQPTVEVPVAQGVERLRIEQHRPLGLLQRQELAAVPTHGSVRCAAVHAGDARVVGVRIAVGPEQRTASRALDEELVGAHITGGEIGVPVVDLDLVDHPVTVDEDVGPEQRRVLRIRARTKVGAAEIRWERTIDLQVVHVRLDPRWGRVAPVHEQIRESHTCGCGRSAHEVLQSRFEREMDIY